MVPLADVVDPDSESKGDQNGAALLHDFDAMPSLIVCTSQILSSLHPMAPWWSPSWKACWQ